MSANSNQSRRRWWSGARRRMLSRAGRAVGLSHDDGRGVEALEQRVHLAVIVWDGGPDGLGTNFHNPVNWVGDVLPGSADDAVIPDIPGSPVIVLAQSAAVRSLASQESLSHTFGTLTVHFPSSVGATYTLDGGQIEGGGSISIIGVLDWRAGEIHGPGGLTIQSGGGLRMNDLSFGNLGRSVVNHGAVSQDDALLSLLPGASLTNHGLWTVSGGGAVNNSGAVPMFTNTGTLRRVAGGPSGTNFGATTGGQLVNSGEIEVLDGVLSIGGADGSNSGTVTIAAGATLDLWAPWSHATGSVIQGGGLLDLPVMVTQSITGSTTWSVAEVRLGGGGTAISGPGSLSIGGLLDWRAGEIHGPGGLTIQLGGELRMNDLSFGNLGRSVVNHGTVSQDDALLSLLPGASLTNHGLWTVSGGGAVNNSGAVPMFTTTGTLRRTLGGPMGTNFGATTGGQVVNSGAIEILDGTLSIGGAGSSNSGTVTIAAGAMLDLTAGWTHNTGSSIAGNGTLFIQSVDPQSIAGASEWSVASIVLDAGTFTGPGTLTVLGSVSWQSGSLSGGTLTGAGDITIVGDVTFGSGSISGSGSLGGSGTMRFDPGTTTLNRPLNIDSMVLQGGTVAGFGAITVANELTWDQGTLGGTASVTVLPDAIVMFSEGTLARTLILEGTMTATGAGNLSFAGGTLIIADGGTLNWFGTGSLIALSGINQVQNHERVEITASGTSVVFEVPLVNDSSAVLVVSTLSTATVTLSGGGTNAGAIDVGSNVTLRFESALTHQSGSMVGGAGRAVLAGPQTISGATTWWTQTISLEGGAINGPGQITLAAGTLQWVAGTISGPGTLAISAGATLDVSAATAMLNRAISNSGTVHVGAGSMLLLPASGQTSSGLFMVEAGGTIDLSGSTFTHNTNSRFNGNGTLQIGNSTQTIATGFLDWKIATIVHSAGLINGTGWLYVWGDLEWTGGQITNSGRLSTWAFGRIVVQHHATLGNTLAITNFGTLIVEPGASLTLTSAPWNMVGTTLFQGNWEVHGTLNFPSGMEIRSLNADVRLVSPAASFPALATLHSIAFFSLLDGATLTITPTTGIATNLNTMTISAGSLLTINGAFVAGPSSSIEFGLAGTNPSQYGRITATGSLTIDGHIGITLAPGYTPAPTVTYNLITGGSPRTGIFQTESLPAAAPGQLYFVGHAAYTVALLHVLPAFWDGGATGLGTNWHDPLNWVGDVLPTAGQYAFIPAGGPTITVTANTTIGGVLSDRAITHSGGTFTINGLSFFDDLYTLSGGTLTGSADFNFNGSLIFNNATLSGTGVATIPFGQTLTMNGAVRTITGRTLDIFGTANWTSGDITMNGNGTLAIRPGGVLNASAEATLNGAGAILNEGQFNKTGTSTTGVSPIASTTLTFTNAATGTIHVQGGTLRGRHLNGGMLVINNFGVISIDAGALLLNDTVGSGSTTVSHAAGSVLTGAGTATVAAGTHTFNAGSQFDLTGPFNVSGGTVSFNTGTPIEFSNQVTLSGGTMTGTDNLLFNGGLIFNNATLSGTGVATIPFGQTLTMNGLVRTMTGRTLEIFGTANWTSGDVTMNGNGTLAIRPGGVFNASAEATLNGAGAILNEGQFNKTGTSTTGVSPIASATLTFTNAATGTIHVQGGTLRGRHLNGGMLVINNFGVISIDAGAVLLNDTVGSGSTTVSHAADSVLTGAGTATIAAGTHTFNTGSQFDLTGPFNVSGGTVTFNTGTPIEFSNQVTLSGGTLTGSSAFTFVGAFTWTGGTLAGTGATVFSAGPAITFSSGTLTANRHLTFERAVTLSGGTLGGSGNFIFGGGLTFNNATMTGSGVATIPAGQTLTMNTESTRNLNRTLEVFGTANWTAGQTRIAGAFVTRPGGELIIGLSSTQLMLAFFANGTILNEGLIRNIGPAFVYFQGQGNTLTFTNAATGTIEAVNAGIGFDTNSGTLNFSSLGTIDVAAGHALTFSHSNPNSPGTLNATFGGGSILTGAGNVQVSYGTITFNTGSTFAITGTYSQSAGTVNFNTGGLVTFPVSASLTGGTLGGGDHLLFAGSLTWNDSTLAGTGVATIPVGQTVTMSTAGTRNLNRTLEVFGTADWTAGLLVLGGGTLAVRPGGQLVANLSTGLNIQTWFSTGTVLNEGLILVAGAGDLYVGGTGGPLTVTNTATGTIHAQNASVYFYTDASGSLTFNSAGTLQIGAGRRAEFIFYSGSGGPNAAFNSGSVVTGAGNFSIGAQATVNFNAGSTFALTGTYSQTGGTVNFNTGAPVQFPMHVPLTGGTLGGSDQLIFNGGLTFNNATMTGSGVATIPAGRTLTMNGTAQRNINTGRTLEVFGTADWTAGNITLGGGTLAVRSGGQFNVSMTQNPYVLEARFNPGSLINEGFIRKTGTQTAYVLSTSGNMIFTNAATGLIEVDAGIFYVALNGGTTTFNHSGGIGVNAGGSLWINLSQAHFNAGSSITGPGSVLISLGTINFNAGSTFALTGTYSQTGGTVTVNSGASVTFAAATLSGGTLTGAGDVSIGGVFTWSGGTLTGSGRTVLLPTGSLSIAAARTTDRPLTVQGMLTVGAGGTLNYRAAMLTNSGTITLSGGGVIRRDLAGTSTLLNTGTVTTGAGGGSLAASTGTLTLDNQGTVLVNSGQTLTVSAFTNFAAGTLAAGTWDVGGTMTLPTATIITTIGADAHVRLVAAGQILRSGSGSALATLATNNGQITLHDGPAWGFKPAGDVFTNNGIFNITGVGTVTVPSHVTFNNGAAGVLGGTLNIGDPMRGPGPVVEFGPFDGGGIININSTVAFNQDFEIFAIVNLFIPGTLTGTGNILISGTLNWYGGAQRGTGSTSVGSGTTLNMFGDGVMTLARSMTNLVAGSWTGGCLLLEGGQFANAMGATFTIGGTVEVVSAGEGGESFSNAGDMILAPGSDVTFGTNFALTNTGSMVIESFCWFEDDETLDGTVELVDGGEIAGPGDVTFTGVLVWSGGSMTGAGATIIDAAALLLMGDGNMTLARTLENFSTAGSWTGGCLLMAGGVFNNNLGASLDIFADPRIDVLGISGDNEFNNHGLITVHTGEFVIGVPGVNTGTIIVIPPDTLIFLAPWTYMPGSSLEGPGGVIFGGGTHSFPVGTFSITGPVGLMTGSTLVLPASSLPNYNAATNTFTGGEWTIGAGAFLFLNGADIRVIGANTTFTLYGDATLDALANLSRIDGALHLEDGAMLAINPNGTNSTLINNGHLRIGPGSMLDIAGSYQQSAIASLHVGIAGVTNALMGRLLVSGSAALGGSFDLTYENGFAATRGNEFRVISSSGTAGAFSAITAPPPPAPNLKAPVMVDAQGVRHLVTHVADWNSDLVVNVTDIFSFLSAWFAGDGDFDGQNGTQVADIFAYLAAWFSA